MNELRNSILTIIILAIGASGPAIANVEEVFPIQFGHGGNWYNPDTPGQGMVFEIVPAQSEDQASVIVVDWMTFSPENVDGGANQRWLFGVSEIVGNPVTIPLLLFGDGRLNDTTTPFARSWGSMTVEFFDCTTGNVDFTVPEGPVDVTSGQFNIQRLTPNVACEE